MNSTDLHALLVVPPVSRAAFFAQLLTVPSPLLQPENALNELATDGVADGLVSSVTPVPPPPTGFPA